MSITHWGDMVWSLVWGISQFEEEMGQLSVFSVSLEVEWRLSHCVYVQFKCLWALSSNLTEQTGSSLQGWGFLHSNTKSVAWCVWDTESICVHRVGVTVHLNGVWARRLLSNRCNCMCACGERCEVAGRLITQCPAPVRVTPHQQPWQVHWAMRTNRSSLKLVCGQ